MKRAIEYEADDGTRFPTAEECKAHDRHTIIMRHDHVLAAIDRTDLALAEAIEFAGNLIAKARIASGDFRRKPKKDSKV